MKEKKRKGLSKLLSMAFTFVMVMVFAGFIGKVDVRADDFICKATVKVKDNSTGEIIENAQVIFTDYYKSGDTYPVIEVTQNEDGTYNLPYDDDDEWGGRYYRYYAVAPGYKDPRTADGAGVLRGASTGCIETATVTLGDIRLEKYPAVNRLETAIDDAQKEIKNYLNQDDYDADQIDEMNGIIDLYLEKIDNEIEIGDNETEETVNAKIEILNGIVSDAKEELDKISTSQDNINEDYADYISFVPESGENKSLARSEYGKFAITLSRFEKGRFKVDNDADTKVNWNAKKEMFSINAGSQRVPFEIIDNSFDKGVFFNPKSFPADVDMNEALGTIENCSVTFTKDGKEVTVTFALNIVGELFSGISVSVPEEVELLRNESLEFSTVLEYGKDYSAKLAYNSGKTEDSDAIQIVSQDESLAVVEENLTIRPLKAGEAAFKATYVDEEGNSFEKEFTITFKTNATEDALLAAVEAANQKAAEAEQKAADAEEAQKAAEQKATAAVEAQKAAEQKAAEAEKKAADAVKAQKAAEKKAADAVKAQKAAEKKANEAIKSTLPKLTLNVKAGTKKATLTWNKSTKGTGYVIYRSTSKNSGYQKIKTITSLKTTSFTDKNLKSKKTYYYKICVYKGSVNGTLSTAKSVKVK